MNTLQDFKLHEHPLIVYDSNTPYICEGCMIFGTGKRYHCHECNFNMHEYCGNCPLNLSSFTHPYHKLKLVEAIHLQRRICKICRDPIGGISYRCQLCEFDVHPLCTQLPEALCHVLHKRHPLRLLGSPEPGSCAICRGACNASSWRYRCALCKFDIHLGCVWVQCKKKMILGVIPKYVPPSILPQQQYYEGYAYHMNPYSTPTSHLFSPGPSYTLQHHNEPQPQNQNHAGRIGQVVFNLVKSITIGVISQMIFGVDVSPLFA